MSPKAKGGKSMSPKAKGGKSMSPEDIVRQYIGIWNNGNSNAFDQVLAPDFVGHDTTRPIDYPDGINRATFKQLFALFHAAFPNATIAEQDMVAEANKVVLRYTLTATHTGQFMGIAPKQPPTEITVGGMALFVINDNGQIAESWVSSDDLGMMYQLGVILLPSPLA
jgi:steroid delta-isomerase-like uncharacterized protein